LSHTGEEVKKKEGEGGGGGGGRGGGREGAVHTAGGVDILFGARSPFIQP